jgi:hypothetical protein
MNCGVSASPGGKTGRGSTSHGRDQEGRSLMG